MTESGGSGRLTDTTDPVRSGRCQWCNGAAEGDDSTLVFTSRGYWWHRDCAVDNEAELSEALG